MKSKTKTKIKKKTPSPPKSFGKKFSSARPWGRYKVLEGGEHWKVKRIVVKPGQRLSYQKHLKRKEHWLVVQGEGVVVLDGKEIRLKAGEAINIPRGSAHRISNPKDIPLVFIEIQQGDYFGEDDIIRLEDDYGRK